MLGLDNSSHNTDMLVITSYSIHYTKLYEVKLTKGIVFKGIVRDISRRKAAEERAASTLEELRKSERDLISYNFV